MPAFQIADFNRALVEHGTLRPNRWSVDIQLPGGIGNGDAALHSNIMARTASVPETSIGEIEVVWEGMSFFEPGDRIVTEFPVTFLGLQNTSLHDSMELWNHQFFLPIDNLRHITMIDMIRDIVLTLNNTENIPIKTYTLQQAWPRSVGEISLDKEARDTTSLFTTIFRYTNVVIKKV